MNSLKISFFLLSNSIFCQNLILNPSFEQTKKCIDNIGSFGEKISNWSVPTSGTTDFFNSCSKNKTGVPENFQGIQNAEFGKNYVGFGLHRAWSTEYVQGKLAEKLIKGKKYKISFYVNLADESNYAVNRFDFLFTDREIKINSLDALSESLITKIGVEKYSYHNIQSEKFYDNKTLWQKVSKEFIATGNEKFLIIGDFSKYFGNDKLKISKKKMKIRKQILSYYYLDMVSVEAIEEDNIKVSHIEEKKTIIEINEDYIFKDVVFEFNNAQLSHKAKLEILNLYSFLIKNDNLKIIISGHTDNIGTETFNKRLSKKRAQVVANYLIELGLDESRISSIGYGSIKPIDTNETEIGRNENRRVEFKIIENN